MTSYIIKFQAFVLNLSRGGAEFSRHERVDTWKCQSRNGREIWWMSERELIIYKSAFHPFCHIDISLYTERIRV